MSQEEVTDRSQRGEYDAFKSLDPRLQSLHDALVKKAQTTIAWYTVKRTAQRIATMRIRWGAVILLGLAAALVALQAAGLPNPIPSFHLGCWAIPAIPTNVVEVVLGGIGSGLLVLDNIFGYSTGWVRYMLTEMAVQRALDDFEMEWSIAVMAAARKPAADPGQDGGAAKLATAQAAFDAAAAAAQAAAARAEAAGAAQADKDAAASALKTQADAQAALDEAHRAADAAAVQAATGSTAVLQQLLKTFSTKIDTLVSDETQQWVIEFQSSMALLQKNARDLQPGAVYGSISVSITRGEGVDQTVAVEIDGQRRAETTAGTVVLSNIPTGIRQVRVSGKKAGAARENFAAATVTANTVTPVSVSLS